MKPKYDFVGVGALNLDMIYEADLKEVSRVIVKEIRSSEEIFCTKRFPELMEYLKRDGRFITKSGGGSAANCIYALARMGAKCGYIGKVGDDEGSDFLLDDLSEAWVDISNIIREPGYCGVCISVTGKDRALIVYPNKNDGFSPKDIKRTPNADYFHLTSFACSFGVGPLRAQERITRDAKGRGSKISFDPGLLYAKRGKEDMDKILTNTDILFLTQEESKFLGGIDLVGIDLGKFPMTAIKLSDRGSRVYWDSTMAEIEPVNARTFMTPEEREMYESGALKLEKTGGGDVFDAGFLAATLRGFEPKTAASFGNYVAAKSITRPGREAYPTARDFMDFFRN